MSDTFNEFVQFISDDPLMLGLCIAVIVLIIIFILVLCLGGKKKGVSEEEKLENNTTELLKTDLQDEPLKSTQEYQLNELNEEKQESIEKTLNVPNVNSFTEQKIEEAAPISVQEAMDLKTTREENEVKDTIQIPVVNDAPNTPFEFPSSTPSEPVASNVQNGPVFPTIDSKPVLPSENIFDSSKPSEENFDDVELPTMAIQKPEVSEPNSASQPFSSVYLNSNEPKQAANDFDFSKTDIIRHVPTMEGSSQTNVSPVNNAPVEKDDDIDLPKLNTTSNTSVLSSLTGESFNIK